MDKDNLNISKIETYLYGILNGVVSKNTYSGTLPDTIQSGWNDMCIIDCSTAIKDLDCYGKGKILIWLYAKPRTDGSKNVTLMSQLEKKLNNAIAESGNGIYHINRGACYSDYDSDRKWHCSIVELNIIVN